MAVERLAYRVSEFAEAIGCSKSKGYEMVQTGQVRAIRIAGMVRVPASEIKRLLTQPDEQSDDAR